MLDNPINGKILLIILEYSDHFLGKYKIMKWNFYNSQKYQLDA